MGAGLQLTGVVPGKHISSLQQHSKRSVACPAILIASVMAARPQPVCVADLGSYSQACVTTGQPVLHTGLVLEVTAATTSVLPWELAADDAHLKEKGAGKLARTSGGSSTGQPGTTTTPIATFASPLLAGCKPTAGSRTRSPRRRWSDIVDEEEEE